MLMGTDDRRIEHHVFVVAVCRQRLENALDNTAFAPSSEPLVNVLPIAKALRKIAPRYAGAVTIKDSFQKKVGCPQQLRQRDLHAQEEGL